MSNNIKHYAKKTETKRGNLISRKPKKRFSQNKNSPIDHILHLQRTIGNRAVIRLVQSGAIQSKLTIGKPNDIYEKEADSVANKVMSMPEPNQSLVNSHSSLAQRKSTCPECLDKEGIQTKPLTNQITPLIQRQAETEEEPVQTKLVQLQTSPDEEKEVQPQLQRQVNEEEEKPIQTKLIQRQGTEEEEKPVQTQLLQRQESEEEKDAQTKLQRQAEEEEPVQEKSLQRQVSSDEEEKNAQTKLQRQGEEFKDEEETAQAKAASGNAPEVTPNIESSINAMKGGGQSLSESTRAFFEPRFGADFSQVRVHSDSRAANTAQAINAKAFTTGKDIMFGFGQYSPGTQSGKRLLAHELTHVMQQGHAGGSQNTLQGNFQFIKIRRYYSDDFIAPSFEDCKKKKPIRFEKKTVEGDECGPQSRPGDPMLKKIKNWLKSFVIPEHPLFPLLYMGGFCKEHDYCYQECNTDPKKDEKKRMQCDKDFYHNAKEQCQDRYGADAIIPITRKWYQKILAPYNLIKNLSTEIVKLPLRALCKLVAWLYYKAVRKWGRSAFLDGQKDACICIEKVSKPAKMKAVVNVSYLLLTDNPRMWKRALHNRKSPHRLAMLKKGTEVRVISKDPKREQAWNKTPAKYGDKYQWWYVEYDPSQGKYDNTGKKQRRVAIRGWVEQRGLSK